MEGRKGRKGMLEACGYVIGFKLIGHVVSSRCGKLA